MWWFLTGFLSIIIGGAVCVWWDGGLSEFFGGEITQGDIIKLLTILGVGTVLGLITPVWLLCILISALWKSEKVIWKWPAKDES